MIFHEDVCQINVHSMVMGCAMPWFATLLSRSATLVMRKDIRFMEAGELMIYCWRNNPKRIILYNKRCRVLAIGKMNSVLVEFEAGNREIVSKFALRKVDETQERQERLL